MVRGKREQLGRISDQIQNVIEKCRRENDRGLTSAEREQFNRLVAEHGRLEDTISAEARADSITARMARPHNPQGISDFTDNVEELADTYRLKPAQKRERERDPYARAFSQYLRGGIDSVESDQRSLLLSRCPDPAFRNTMSTTTGSQGGFIIPAGFSDELERAKKWFGGIDGVVRKFVTETGNTMPWPTVNDTANRGRIVGENVQMAETDLVFNQVAFSAYIGSSDLVLIPLALTEDSYFDLDALVASLVGERLGRLFNWKCTTGSGSNEPTGIVTGAAASGNVLTLASGNTATVAYANLVDLEHSVDPAYRYEASSYFMFSDAVLKLLKLLVDGNNRPLWQPGLTASFREGAIVDLAATGPTILGHKYIVNQDMAIPAANAYSMLFGDASKFVVRELRSGTSLMVLRERYADYLQLGVTAFQRFDSNLVNAGQNPIALLQQSAS